MSKAQRDKGHNYEREIARLFREIYPDAARHLEYQKEEAAAGVDVVAGPFTIQCKNTAKFVPAKTLFDVQAEAHQIPLLVCRDGRRGCENLVVFKWFSTLRLNFPVKQSSFLDCPTLKNPKSYPSLAKAYDFMPQILGLNFGEDRNDLRLIVMPLSDFLQAIKNEVANE